MLHSENKVAEFLCSGCTGQPLWIVHNDALCVCVCLFRCLGAVSWWKPWAEAYIRAPALIKGQQAVFHSFWEQHWFLLPLWQQDKVPFQLEKYLATYLPTVILGSLFFMPFDEESLLFLHCAFCPGYAHVNVHPFTSHHTTSPFTPMAPLCCVMK